MRMRRDDDLEALIISKYAVVAPVLNERARRLWAATESLALGYGGDALVSAATGLARQTIRNGRREIDLGLADAGRVRSPGAGRPSLKQTQPGLEAALERLVDPVTRGDPISPLRWTCKSRAKLAAALAKEGWRVSSTSVGRLLNRLGYRLQAVQKSREGGQHPDRNAQFEYINDTATDYLQRLEPVISVDTKKKELVGNFKNSGQEGSRHPRRKRCWYTISPRTRRAKPSPTVCTTWGVTRPGLASGATTTLLSLRSLQFGNGGR